MNDLPPRDQGRAPGAFKLHEQRPTVDVRSSPPPQAPRHPRAITGDALVTVVPAREDPPDFTGDKEATVPPLDRPHRSRLGAIFFGALGTLVTLGIGLWLDGLVRDLFSRADWLGWLATALAALAAASLLAILVREALALRRLASVADLQRRAIDVAATNDPKAARAIVADLVSFTAAKPQTAAGRRTLADLDGEIIDGVDLLRLAETEILTPLDEIARTMVLDAGKRVSVVTAVSPRALVDLAFVVYESGRLIRRIAELYGGRPGTIGFFRLARSVLAHLAVTGTIAAGDGIVQQLVGHGLAARLSARLGEGVVNGMMTIRIGIAAMETARPLPFNAVRRPGISDFVAQLGRFWEKRTGTREPDA